MEEILESNVGWRDGERAVPVDGCRVRAMADSPFIDAKENGIGNHRHFYYC